MPAIRLPAITAILALVPYLVMPGVAQDQTTLHVFDKDSTTINRYLEGAIKSGNKIEFDELYLIALNRSDLLIPFVLEQLRSDVNQSRLEDLTSDKWMDVIAYSAKEEAVTVMEAACAKDTPCLERGVRRSLNYASTRAPGTSFSLAYAMLASADSRIVAATEGWVADVIRYPHFQRDLSVALLKRYGRVPDAGILKTDPITKGITDHDLSGVQASFPATGTQEK
jgi:hypothetical protein